MPAYRLYCLDGAGRIQSARWIAADDDGQALLYAAAQECDEHHCELWERGRRVGQIPQKPKMS